jgi:hypothetical protein
MQEFDLVEVTIKGDKKSTFVKAVELAMWEHRWIEAYTFKNGVLTMYWHKHENDPSIPLLYKMDAIQAAEYLWGLVQSLPRDAYGEKPDTDGSNSRGWEITNVDHYQYTAFSIKPYWNTYGK